LYGLLTLQRRGRIMFLLNFWSLFDNFYLFFYVLRARTNNNNNYNFWSRSLPSPLSKGMGVGEHFAYVNYSNIARIQYGLRQITLAFCYSMYVAVVGNLSCESRA